jgi:hypothetical protein
MLLKDELRILLDELELFGYNRKRLAEKIEYSQDAIRKALRYGPSDKLFNKIKGLHESESEKAKNPVSQMYQEIKQLRAELYATRVMLADVLAKLSDHRDSAAVILANYDKLIEGYLKKYEQ